MEQLLRLTRPDIRRYALRHCAAKSRLHRARCLVREYLVQPTYPDAEQPDQKR